MGGRPGVCAIDPGTCIGNDLAEDRNGFVFSAFGASRNFVSRQQLRALTRPFYIFWGLIEHRFALFLVLLRLKP
jgi:hypothetical protein